MKLPSKASLTHVSIRPDAKVAADSYDIGRYMQDWRLIYLTAVVMSYVCTSRLVLWL